MNLRKLARDQECQIRIPGVCCRDDSTVVLAHFRMAGLCGTGKKPSDLIGAWACRSCHDAIDGRIKTPYSHDELRLMHLEGMARTLNELVKQGVFSGLVG